MIKMEYADGGTLAQMLSRRARRLDEREIIMLFRQIVAAIRYMHDHNILHRYVQVYVICDMGLNIQSSFNSGSAFLLLME